jgi:Flp pilus assembly protein CpaB
MDTMIVIIAIVAALGVLGVVIVDTILSAAQVASAAPPPTKGCRSSLAFNESGGKCFHGVR